MFVYVCVYICRASHCYAVIQTFETVKINGLFYYVYLTYLNIVNNCTGFECDPNDPPCSTFCLEWHIKQYKSANVCITA